MINTLNANKSGHPEYDSIIRKLKSKNKSKHKIMIETLFSDIEVPLRSKLDAKFRFRAKPAQTDRQRLVNRNNDDEIIQSMPNYTQLASVLILPTTAKVQKPKPRVPRGKVKTAGRALTHEQYMEEYESIINSNNSNKNKNKKNKNEAASIKSNTNTNRNIAFESDTNSDYDEHKGDEDVSEEQISDFVREYVLDHQEVGASELLDVICVKEFGGLTCDQEAIAETVWAETNNLRQDVVVFVLV